MLYHFNINTCIVTSVLGVSNTLTRRVTLRLQLVYIESLEESLLNTVDAKNFKDFFQIF